MAQRQKKRGEWEKRRGGEKIGIKINDNIT
jgi:hypothetical protein